MSSVPEDKYLFKLVAFLDDEIDPVSIDIVPGKWIFWDDEADELLCSYMPGELTEKKKKDLQKMVQQCKPADPKWPKYRVMIKGRAQTYEDAEIGIDQLGRKKYAYSTDDEIKCLEKARQEKKTYQRKKVTSDTITIEEQLESARVDLTESVEEQGPEDSAGAIKSRKTAFQSYKPKEASRSDTSSSDKRLQNERLRASAPSRIDSQSSPSSISSKKSLKRSRLDLDLMELGNNRQNAGLSTLYEGFNENYSLRELVEQCHREMKKLVSDLKGVVVSNGIAIKRLREDLIENSARGIVGIEEEEEHPDDIQLPCTTLETFDLFEHKLNSDAAYRKKMKRLISKSTDRDQEMTRCLGTCIRMFVTQSVGMLFVPLKATKDKRVFMDTALCKIVQDIFVRVFGTQENPVSTQKFQKSLKGILHNTKDWPGEAKRVRGRDKKNDNTLLVGNLSNEEQDSDV